MLKILLLASNGDTKPKPIARGRKVGIKLKQKR